VNIRRNILMENKQSVCQPEKNIAWAYSGTPDYATGTGACAAEKILGWASAALVPAALLVSMANDRLQLPESPALVAFTLFLAFDVGGGVVCNSLNSGKRFYHSPPKQEEGLQGKVMKNHLAFSAFHIHSILVWLLFQPDNYTFGIPWYLLLLGSAFVVHRTPLYLKRPVSMLLVMAAVLINLYALPPVAGFEWLMPLLFLKIVYGHMVMEEPYRPVDEIPSV
jgi:hypothetical protein